MAKPLKFKDFLSVDYTKTGDDQVSYNAKKRKKDILSDNTGEEIEVEALDMSQRMAKSRQMKKLKSKIAMGRKRAMRKTAGMDVIKKRAQKAARTQFAKKLTKDVPKSELSMARKQEIEKRLEKMKPRIDKLAKKLIPQVRKKEMERKKGSSSAN